MIVFSIFFGGCIVGISISIAVLGICLLCEKNNKVCVKKRRKNNDGIFLWTCPRFANRAYLPVRVQYIPRRKAIR